MDPASDSSEVEIQLDPNDIYREESYTDRKVGSIRCLIPVTHEGAEDSSRKRLFVGQTQLWSQMGPIPITFEINAENLDQAIKAFPAAAQEGGGAVPDLVSVAEVPADRVLPAGAHLTTE